MKKKNGFLTLVFACFPGAGQMYQGYMKRGISLTLACCTLFSLTMYLYLTYLLIFLIPLWLFSFFDSYNLRAQTPEQAAANAISDVYAMGGEPKLALNIMAVPKNMPKEAVHELLRGGYDKVYEAGALITGGHSILDDEPKYGLAVTGFVHPDKILTNSGARPGDVLFFTKPLGLGVITSAAKADLTEPETMALAHEMMTTLNKSARDVMVKYRVHACTDVTGFGLLGHLYEMARGSEACIRLDTSAICFLPQALELARMGILPEGMYRNRDFAQEAVEPGKVELAVQDLLYDPQTAGGLVMACSPEDANALWQELQGAVPCAQQIGVVEEYSGGAWIILE